VKHLKVYAVPDVQPIWKEIVRIHFTDLASLTFVGTELTSVDQLTHLSIPQLYLLDLGTSPQTKARINSGASKH
jgi:hypothetical protein